MVLLSEVVSIDDTQAVSRTVIGQQMAPFARADGSVSGSVILELMAQTVGLFAGRRARLRGQAPQIGFLLGTRSMSCTVSELAAGTQVQVRVRCVYLDEDNDLPSQFACEATLDDRVISEANLTVYQPQDLKQWNP